MPMTEPLPWRYRDDAYYQKGAFSIEFDIAPVGEEPGLDEEARRRALQQLLLALRDEAGLKVSSFVDVWAEPSSDAEDFDDAEEVDEGALPEDAAAETAAAEFVVYNKLGVTSLAKLRRFMEAHLKGDVQPRLVLIDPETSDRFRCTNFTIRYLFHEFIAHQPPDDWNRLRELLASEDRGYRELTRTASTQKKNAMPKFNSIEELARNVIIEIEDYWDPVPELEGEWAEAVYTWVQDNYMDTDIIRLYVQEYPTDDRTLDPDFTWPRDGGTLREAMLELTGNYLAEVAVRLLR